MRLSWLGCPVFVLLLGNHAPAQQTGPVISGDSFDFGMAPRNATIMHRLWLQANNTDTLRIQEIKTGCACIAAVAQNAEVAPADSLPITLYWNTRGDEREVSRTAYIFLVDRPDPYRVTMTADCRGDLKTDGRQVDISPWRARLGSGNTVDAGRQRLTISNFTEDQFTISVASLVLDSIPVEAIEVDLPDTLSAAAIERGSISLLPAYGSTSFSGSMTLEFSSDGRRNYRVTIPISGSESSGQATLSR